MLARWASGFVGDAGRVMGGSFLFPILRKRREEGFGEEQLGQEG